MAQQYVLFAAGSADTLPVGADKINDNFTELYARVGPCCSSKYLDLQKAIKLFAVNNIAYNRYFYVSKIVAGTGPVAGHYTYTIEVHVTEDFATAGMKVMTYTITTVDTPKTGLEVINLTEYTNNGSGSGYFGTIGINWSLLELGATYTCANWSEGGIYAPILLSAAAALPGGGGIVVDPGPGLITGIQKVYVFNPQSDIGEVLPALADMVGDIILKNISETYYVEFKGANYTETFDGTLTGFRLGPGESVTLAKLGTATSDYLCINGKLNAIP